jgi:excinuclease ABC subunit C
LLRIALELIRPIFPYSTCNPPFAHSIEWANGAKPCFHYQIGLCPGVCINKVDVGEYKKSIRNLILFFRGEKKQLLRRLKKENPEKIKALQHIEDTALLADSKTLEAATEVASRRIEGYDISHLAGKDPVGAMVVFENGEKDSSQYRLFKIYRSNTQDDLAMLQEVLERRLNHKEWPLPDIVFIDGGANQVRRAAQVLAKAHIQVPVVGLSKAGKHAGSAFSQDKMVIANAKKVGKDLIFSSKKLFQEVRNEAHRFAIGFQRKRTRKGFISKGWIKRV